MNSEGVVATQIYQKENKKDVTCVSKIPKRYKQHIISGDLHKSRKMASNFDIEQSKQNTTKLEIGGNLWKVPFEILLYL